MSVQLIRFVKDGKTPVIDNKWATRHVPGFADQ